MEEKGKGFLSTEMLWVWEGAGLVGSWGQVTFLLWIWRREAVGEKIWRVEELGTNLAMGGPHVGFMGSLGLERASLPSQLRCAMLQ